MSVAALAVSAMRYSAAWTRSVRACSASWASRSAIRFWAAFRSVDAARFLTVLVDEGLGTTYSGGLWLLPSAGESLAHSELIAAFASTVCQEPMEASKSSQLPGTP